MKRHSIRTPIVVSGIFFLTMVGAITAFFGQTNSFKLTFTDLNEVLVKKVLPIKGHWLKTGQDNSYIPASPEVEYRPFDTQPPARSMAPAVFTLEEAKSALNKTTDCINVMYVWSDNDQLKVISVTSFNKATKQAAITVIPLYTVVNNATSVNLQNSYTTIQELYKTKGREGVRSFLEQKLEIKIPNFVQVNQSALRKLSDIIGVLRVNGKEITMLEAFEQTAAGIRTDDSKVVRAVASQVLKPGIILEVPNLLNIFTHDIYTNFSPQEMVEIFYISRQMDLKQMRKTALPGYEYCLTSELKFLFVSEQAWKNIVYDITQLSPP